MNSTRIKTAILILKGFLRRQRILQTVFESKIVEHEGSIHFLRSLVREYLYDVRDWKISHDLSLLLKLAGLGMAFSAGSLPPPNGFIEIQSKDVKTRPHERWLDWMLKFLWKFPLLPDIALGEVSVLSIPKTASSRLKEIDYDAQQQTTKTRTIKTGWYTNWDIVITAGKYEVDILDRKRYLDCKQEIDITDGGDERV